jgi:hypothetical protein
VEEKWAMVNALIPVIAVQNGDTVVPLQIIAVMVVIVALASKVGNNFSSHS